MDPKDTRSIILRAAWTRLGSAYLLGGKWPLEQAAPTGPIDCSGFVRWAYAQGGLIIPDGSYNQFADSKDIVAPDLPLPGDLGFFRDEQGRIHHVGMLYDEEQVIEARGNPYNAVIFRPRAAWEAWREFTGWRRPNTWRMANGS